MFEARSVVIFALVLSVSTVAINGENATAVENDGPVGIFPRQAATVPESPLNVFKGVGDRISAGAQNLIKGVEKFVVGVLGAIENGVNANPDNIDQVFQSTTTDEDATTPDYEEEESTTPQVRTTRRTTTKPTTTATPEPTTRRVRTTHRRYSYKPKPKTTPIPELLDAEIPEGTAKPLPSNEETAIRTQPQLTLQPGLQYPQPQQPQYLPQPPQYQLLQPQNPQYQPVAYPPQYVQIQPGYQPQVPQNPQQIPQYQIPVYQQQQLQPGQPSGIRTQPLIPGQGTIIGGQQPNYQLISQPVSVVNSVPVYQQSQANPAVPIALNSTVPVQALNQQFGHVVQQQILAQPSLNPQGQVQIPSQPLNSMGQSPLPNQQLVDQNPIASQQFVPVSSLQGAVLNSSAPTVGQNLASTNPLLVQNLSPLQVSQAQASPINAALWPPQSGFVNVPSISYVQPVQQIQPNQNAPLVEIPVTPVVTTKSPSKLAQYSINRRKPVRKTTTAIPNTKKPVPLGLGQIRLPDDDSFVNKKVKPADLIIAPNGIVRPDTPFENVAPIGRPSLPPPPPRVPEVVPEAVEEASTAQPGEEESSTADPDEASTTEDPDETDNTETDGNDSARKDQLQK